jgi:2-oxoisovalerate dehydrogenase E1 component alpha subunit
VHKLPVLFMVENNIYAISVHQSEQMAVANVAEKAAGLGLPGVSVDGLDPLAVYDAVANAASRARQGQGPSVIEVKVHRMTPHSSDDDDRSYRPTDEVEAMKADDPLLKFAAVLKEKSILTDKVEAKLDAKAKGEIDSAVEAATRAPYPKVSEASYPVYAEEIPVG